MEVTKQCHKANCPNFNRCNVAKTLQKEEDIDKHFHSKLLELGKNNPEEFHKFYNKFNDVLRHFCQIF